MSLLFRASCVFLMILHMHRFEGNFPVWSNSAILKECILIVNTYNVML